MIFFPLFTQNISFLAYRINLCHASMLFACCCYFKHWICFVLFTISLLECYINCYSMNSPLISHKVNVKFSPKFTDGQRESYKHSTEGEYSIWNILNIDNHINHGSSFWICPMIQPRDHKHLKKPPPPAPIPPPPPTTPSPSPDRLPPAKEFSWECIVHRVQG